MEATVVVLTIIHMLQTLFLFFFFLMEFVSSSKISQVCGEKWGEDMKRKRIDGEIVHNIHAVLVQG